MRDKEGGMKQKGFWEPVRGKRDSIIIIESYGYDNYLGMSYIAGTPSICFQNTVKIVLS